VGIGARGDSNLMKSRLESNMQTTLRDSVVVEGVGAHSNCAGRVTLAPAEAGTGVVFSPTRSFHGAERPIPAHWSRVSGSQLRTCIGDDSATISTIEHLMAALFGLGVDNAAIEVEGPEIPAMDGSARAFAAAIEEAGVVNLSAPRRMLKVIEPVTVELGDSLAELRPTQNDALHLDLEIDFPGTAIGRQRRSMILSKENFLRELSRARSFGFVSDAERLWKRGLALGASLENTIVLGNDRVLNREGLRFEDEFVRHKMLDAVGDLALVGAPIIGAFRSCRGGHRLNLALVERLMSTPTAFRMIGVACERPEAAHGSYLSPGHELARP
jgi:UDP-3-O-[3-hydroxymyristoyl] N-acetylglucosamine deacetylase